MITRRLNQRKCCDEDLTVRPISGPDELDLFCRFPYVLNDELAGDLEAGRRRPNRSG